MRKMASRPEKFPYKVGKGSTPLATRFKPGVSGNPKGRPKGSKNTNTLFYEALNQKLEMSNNGKVRKITAREGIILKIVNQALKGDIKAVQFVLAKEPEIIKSQQKPRWITKDMDVKEAQRVYEESLKENPFPYP